MGALDRLMLVIPCFNEAARLDRCALDAALGGMGWLDLCLVDDGSTDGTADVLHAVEHAWPGRVATISLPRNRGKAEAVRQGLLFASARRHLCGFWDADFSAPLSELAALRHTLDASEDVEWAWGIRLRSLGRRVERRASRHYLGRAFATVTSIVLGLPSYDTQCGAKLFRVGPLLREVLSEPFTSRWIFDVEMLARAEALLWHSGGAGVEQVVNEQPLAVWQHRAGSKVRPTDFFRACHELVQVRRQRARWVRPFSSSAMRASAQGRVNQRGGIGDATTGGKSRRTCTTAIESV